jgi:hypothetical protein
MAMNADIAAAGRSGRHDVAAGRSGRRALALAVAGYSALACVLTWPLPLHLRTHLLSAASGDTAVYVWNIWVFRHELIEHAHLPFSTGHVLAYTGGTDLSLHNYAPIAGLLGLPLVGPLGIIGTYNVLMLVFMALSGLGVFLLAGQLGLGAVFAWSAGALFVASPVMTARQTGHFSLVIAAALPLFLWALLRALDTERVRDAVLVGVLVAAATYSDAYYGVYCAMMGAFLIAWRFGRVEWRGASAWRRLARFLDVTIAVSGILIAWRVASGTTTLVLGPIAIGLQTLYTPVLLLTCAVALRAWLAWRPVWRVHDSAARLPALLRLGAMAVAACLVLLLPQLFGIARAFVTDQLPGTEIYWRSSPRGVDALAYFVPNPNHAWFGDHTRQWFMPPDEPNWYPEFVGAFSLVAFAVIAAGARLRVLPACRRHQHVRAGALDLPPLCSGDRDGAVSFEIRHRRSARAVAVVCVWRRGFAASPRQDVGRHDDPARARFRTRSGTRAGAPPSLSGVGAGHLRSRHCGRRRVGTAARPACGHPRWHVARWTVRCGEPVLPDRTPTADDRRLPVPGLPAEQGGASALPDAQGAVRIERGPRPVGGTRGRGSRVTRRVSPALVHQVRRRRHASGVRRPARLCH